MAPLIAAASVAPDAPTATDFFCGGGGSTEGLTQAGFWGRVACNHDPVSVETHRRNHPRTEHRCEDLNKLDYTTLPRTDLLWASPSCVWHSRAGGRRKPTIEQERRRADPGSIDRATAFAVIEAAEIHRYPVIITENVPEFTEWSLFGWWGEGLTRLEYTLHTMVLDAADFGHAQHRKRWFGVATQPGIDIDLTPEPMAPVYASAIIDTDPALLKPVTRPLYISPQIAEITDPGVPHLVTYRRNAHAARADAHRLATVTAGGNHHALAMVDHDGRAWHRMLTNRECARAQGFPDHYEFVGAAPGMPRPRDPQQRRRLSPTRQIKRQIGNAVPVGIARFLGARAAAALGYSTASVAA